MKKLKIVNENLNEICLSLLKHIEIDHFQFMNTRGGNVAVIFSQHAGGTHPLMGAYFTSNTQANGEWIACKWMKDGKYQDKRTSLDLEMYEPEEQIVS